MDQEQSRDEGPTEEAYLKTYEATQRKRKVLILVIAVVLIAAVVFAFVRGLGTLGQMNEDVHGAFTESNAPADEAAQEGQGETPPADAGTNVAPAESPTPPVDAAPEATTPETEAAPTPAPAETEPTPAP